MISNSDLKKVNSEEKLDKLFEIFGLEKTDEKIQFIEQITGHFFGPAGSEDLKAAKEFFLAHRWQPFTRQ